MRNITGGIRLFKSRAQGSIERALNYPIEVAGAMQAIFGNQNLQNLSAALPHGNLPQTSQTKA